MKTTVEPTTRLTFLERELDTMSMKIRLPEGKLTELRLEFKTAYSHKDYFFMTCSLS